MAVAVFSSNFFFRSHITLFTHIWLVCRCIGALSYAYVSIVCNCKVTSILWCMVFFPSDVGWHGIIWFMCQFIGQQYCWAKIARVINKDTVEPVGLIETIFFSRWTVASKLKRTNKKKSSVILYGIFIEHSSCQFMKKSLIVYKIGESRERERERDKWVEKQQKSQMRSSNVFFFLKK